ncbi:MAG TPA: hypothetical protein DCX27_18950, partial [Balneola sp.]|nr:hypothetical protein [Balneola sp.]
MWNPVNCKTHYSLQHGFCKTDKLAKGCAEYGYTACGIADFGTVSGAVEFQQECKKHGVKAIIGCEFDDFILYAKNKKGWLDLVKYLSNQKLDVLTEIAKKGNTLCVSNSKNGFANLFKSNHVKMDHEADAVYYVYPDEAECHRIMLCGKLRTTLKKVGSKDHDYEKFFECSDFYLPKQDTVFARSKREMENRASIVDRCEEYDLAEQPMLPTFECPEGYSEDEWLTELCRIGWKEKLIPKGKVATAQDQEIYSERIKSELKVIIKAELSGYFLIVQDIINWVKAKGWLAGPGRGSAAGCLISYLMSITEVDPIEYDL